MRHLGICSSQSQWFDPGLLWQGPQKGEQKAGAGTLYATQLRDPEKGVKFVGPSNAFSPMAGGAIFTPSVGTVKVSSYTPIFTDAQGNSVAQPNYFRFHAFYAIGYEWRNFTFSTPPERTPPQRIDSKRNETILYKATANLKAQSDGRLFLGHSLVLKVVAAFDSENLPLDVFRTETGDYFVKLKGTQRVTWHLAKVESEESQRQPQFQNTMQVNWEKVDPFLARLIQNIRQSSVDEKQSRIQDLLDYLRGKTAYSWRNEISGRNKEERARDLLSQSNCSGHNIAGADMLDQATIPVRYTNGLMASEKEHSRVEAFVRGQWVIVDFTAPIRNPSSDRPTSSWLVLQTPSSSGEVTTSSTEGADAQSSGRGAVWGSPTVTGHPSQVNATVMRGNENPSAYHSVESTAFPSRTITVVVAPPRSETLCGRNGLSLNPTDEERRLLGRAEQLAKRGSCVGPLMYFTLGERDAWMMASGGGTTCCRVEDHDCGGHPFGPSAKRAVWQRLIGLLAYPQERLRELLFGVREEWPYDGYVSAVEKRFPEVKPIADQWRKVDPFKHELSEVRDMSLIVTLEAHLRELTRVMALTDDELWKEAVAEHLPPKRHWSGPPMRRYTTPADEIDRAKKYYEDMSPQQRAKFILDERQSDVMGSLVAILAILKRFDDNPEIADYISQRRTDVRKFLGL